MTTQRDHKKHYETPKLVVHGNVERITLETDKKLGVADGFTFMGQSITNNS